MAKYRHECDAQVQADADPKPRYDHLENRVINIEQVYRKASEEEGQGKVYENGQRLNRPRKVKLLDALSEERPDLYSIVWVVPWLGNFHIPTCPLLQ